MRKAIEFGIKNSEIGIIGSLLLKSGYEVILTEISTEVIREIIDAEIIVVSEEIESISKVSSIIAAGVKLRKEKNIQKNLNIISCESIIEASSKLKEEIQKDLNEDEVSYLNKYVGFPNCLIDEKIVLRIDENVINSKKGEYCSCLIQSNEFKGEIPNIKEVKVVDDLKPYIERNIFTINTIYAMIAYFGYIRGYTSISESINDDFIYKLVKKVAGESGLRIVYKYDFDNEDNLRYTEKIIDGFKDLYFQAGELKTGRNQLERLNEYAEKTNNFNNIDRYSKVFNMINEDMRGNK